MFFFSLQEIFFTYVREYRHFRVFGGVLESLFLTLNIFHTFIVNFEHTPKHCKIPLLYNKDKTNFLHHKKKHVLLDAILDTQTRTGSWTVYYCVKGICIKSFPGQLFSAFGLKNFVSLRIHPECGKIRTRKTPNTKSFT